MNQKERTSSVKQWLFDEGFIQKVTPENKKEISHLLMEGGNVMLPRTKEREFLKKYAESLRSGEQLYFVEVRPQVFRFMIDIDISDDHYWTNEEILNISTFVNKIVSEFYENPICICNIAGPKQKDEEIHTGAHLIFPKIFINADNAKLIRNAILKKIENESEIIERGFKKPLNKTWEDIFDSRIYEANGYRMIGSDKITRHKPENRIYWPIAVIDHEGKKLDFYLRRLLNRNSVSGNEISNYEDLMFETSIRYVPENYFVIDDMGMMPKIPSWISSDMIPKSRTSRKYNTAIKLNNEKILIEHFIKEKLPEYKNYQNIITDVLRTPANNLLIKTNCKFCLNLGHEHKSCGIYFMIYKDFSSNYSGLIQKCLCPCENLKGRKHGLCRDFESQCVKIPEDINYVLFPYGFLEESSVDVKESSVDVKENMEGGVKEDVKEDMKKIIKGDVKEVVKKDVKKKSKKEEEKKIDNKMKKETKGKFKKSRPGRYTEGMLAPKNIEKMILQDCGKLMKKLIN